MTPGRRYPDSACRSGCGCCPDAVDAIRFETAAFGAAAADLPKRFRDGELRAELRDAAVDRDATHDRDDFLIFVFVPFKVEQNLERATHKLCFLGLQK